MVANCNRPIRLSAIDVDARPDRMRDLLRIVVIRAISDYSRLSVTSTTCAGRPSALWGKLALGRKGIQIVLVAMPKAAFTWR